MIPLEDQVISLKIAKKLHDLNVNQNSHFYWRPTDGLSEFRSHKIVYCGELTSNDINNNEYIYSAYTSAELGAMLPDNIKIQGRYVNGKVRTAKLKLFVRDIKEHECNCPDCTKSQETYKVWHVEYSYKKLIGDYIEANARGLMLVYLLEQKLMEVPK
jgi:hypothetical protein